MEFADYFKKFTGIKTLDIASRYDYHLCICSLNGGEPYYAMIEFSRFGWVVDDEDMEILAYCEFMPEPVEIIERFPVDKNDS